ncbi:antibiotic biosynthesis monooxygenase [bacterium]|nr:antibiotic biosynthesis monooxygenase [candidate division CSSED10-310 bacterium]
MVIVRIVLEVLPAKRLEVVQTVLSLTERMTMETGCRNYSTYCDLSEGNMVSVFEEWDNRDVLDRHLTSAVFSIFLGLRSLLSKPHCIQVYSVLKVERLPGVDGIREEAV